MKIVETAAMTIIIQKIYPYLENSYFVSEISLCNQLVYGYFHIITLVSNICAIYAIISLYLYMENVET